MLPISLNDVLRLKKDSGSSFVFLAFSSMLLVIFCPILNFVEIPLYFSDVRYNVIKSTIIGVQEECFEIVDDLVI